MARPSDAGLDRAQSCGRAICRGLRRIKAISRCVRQRCSMTPLQIYSAHVPRYTSYPTAPHFHKGVDAAAYGEWLASLTPGTPLSLYLHIPFCDTLCWFCACHTTVVNNYVPVRDYLGLFDAYLVKGPA